MRARHLLNQLLLVPQRLPQLLPAARGRGRAALAPVGVSSAAAQPSDEAGPTAEPPRGAAERVELVLQMCEVCYAGLANQDVLKTKPRQISGIRGSVFLVTPLERVVSKPEVNALSVTERLRL